MSSLLRGLGSRFGKSWLALGDLSVILAHLEDQEHSEHTFFLTSFHVRCAPSHAQVSHDRLNTALIEAELEAEQFKEEARRMLPVGGPQLCP